MEAMDDLQIVSQSNFNVINTYLTKDFDRIDDASKKVLHPLILDQF